MISRTAIRSVTGLGAWMGVEAVYRRGSYRGTGVSLFGVLPWHGITRLALRQLYGGLTIFGKCRALSIVQRSIVLKHCGMAGKPDFGLI